MDTKPEIRIAKGTKVTRVKAGVMATDVPTFIQTTTTSDDNSHLVFADDVALYVSDEGKTWVRGWTGKIVTTFKRSVLTEDRRRKLTRAKAERKHDEERAAHTIDWLRRAADTVKRAKLPKELRSTAFMAVLSPYGPMIR